MSGAVLGAESTFRRSAPEWGRELTGRVPGVRFFGPAHRSDRLAPIKLISTTVQNASCAVHVHSPLHGTAGWCLPGDGRAVGRGAGNGRGPGGGGGHGAAGRPAAPPRAGTPRRRRGSM